MKKKVFTIVILLAVVLVQIVLFVGPSLILSSCSTEQENFVPQNNENEISIAVEHLNDSLINEICFLTRGHTQEKVDTTKTDVVEADVMGAIVGGTAGAFVDPEIITKSVAVIGGAIIGAAITSITAAVDNANKDCDGVGVVMKSVNRINYPNSLVNYNMIDIKEVDSMNTLSTLSLPEKYIHLRRIGIMHNIMVDKLLKDDNLYDDSQESKLIPKEVTKRKKYEKNFNDMIKNCLNWKSIRKDKKSNVGIIINSFMSIYLKCVSINNKDEAMKVLKAYIELVHKRNDLAEKEKDCLISSFCVAWYSYLYWSEELHWK